MTIFEKFKQIETRLASITKIGERNPFAVTIEKPLSSTVGLIEGRETLLFGTNNYLGLSQSHAAIDSATDAARSFGVGTTGSRIANGTQTLHQRLEKAIATYFNRPSCMVFSTGYQANLGVISALTDKDDYLLIDSDSHASIYDGSRLGYAHVIRFRHNDPEDLRKRISRLDLTKGNCLIVVEGIYSMLGDIAPLKEFIDVKQETGAWILVDEAHSFGVLGPNGRGVSEMVGVEEKVDFIVGTFSKSLGTIGGYCTSIHSEFELLRLASRPYMFTASLPPEIIAATLTNLKTVATEPQLRKHLMEAAEKLHTGLNRIGLKTAEYVSPIIAVILDSTEDSIRFWNRLLDHGVYVNLSLPPATPDDRPLLRCSVMASHTMEQIDRTVHAFDQVAHELKIGRKFLE